MRSHHSWKRIAWKRIAFVVSSVFLATSCSGNDSSSSPTTITNFPVGEAKWGPCDGKDAPEEPFQCATLDVPRDYAEPDGDTISLALVRLPASGKRRGVVLTNPGGPGGSGFDFVVSAGESLSQSLDLGDYDLIGFDPRGVDRSGGIRCLSDEVMEKYLYVDSTPDTPEEQLLYDEAEDIFETECKKTYGQTLGVYSTINTAHDMDLIRRSMRQDTIHYIGISYGTYLGGVYATTYPDNIESMFFDAPFDPQGDTVEQQYLTQIRGFEEAFNSWSLWCESDTACAFHSSDVGVRWDQLLERLDTQSVITESGRAVNNAVMEEATTQSMYARSLWPIFAAALADAEKGIGEGLLRLADSYNGRNEDGTFSSINQSNPVIRCASGFGKDPPEDAAALIAELQKVAPRFSKDVSEDDFDGNTCDDLLPDAPLYEISYSGAAPIVVVGGVNDPATPIRWAEELVANLGTNARLVRFNGEGHSQLMVSDCVDRIASDMFSVDQLLPDNNTTCEPDPLIDAPDFWSDLPALGPDETRLDPSILGPLVGLDPTDSYAEYRAFRGTAQAAYASYKMSMGVAGFRPTDSTATGATDSPVFFERGANEVVYFPLDERSLRESQLLQPSGPVPVGHTLVILAYLPR